MSGEGLPSFAMPLDLDNAHALAEERSDDSQQRVVGGLNQEG